VDFITGKEGYSITLPGINLSKATRSDTEKNIQKAFRVEIDY